MLLRQTPTTTMPKFHAPNLSKSKKGQIAANEIVITSAADIESEKKKKAAKNTIVRYYRAHVRPSRLTTYIVGQMLERGPSRAQCQSMG